MDLRHKFAILAMIMATFASLAQMLSIHDGRDVRRNSLLLSLNALTYILCIMSW